MVSQLQSGQTQSKNSMMEIQMNGTIFGYDPGGNGRNGVAILTINNGKIINATVKRCKYVDDVLKALPSDLIAAGIDTITCFGTTHSGYRMADMALRGKYRDCIHSVCPPNSLRGSMVINGIAVVLEIEKRFPDALITETHPKVLYVELAKKHYDYKTNQIQMNKEICCWINSQLSIDTDHEWDALISAYAAYKGWIQAWEHDLHKGDNSMLIFSKKKPRFFWPITIPAV